MKKSTSLLMVLRHLGKAQWQKSSRMTWDLFIRILVPCIEASRI